MMNGQLYWWELIYCNQNLNLYTKNMKTFTVMVLIIRHTKLPIKIYDGYHVLQLKSVLWLVYKWSITLNDKNQHN